MDNRIDNIIISSMGNIFARTVVMVLCLYFLCELIPKEYILSVYQYYHLTSVAIIILLSIFYQFLVIRATDVIDTYQNSLSVKRRLEMYRKTGTNALKMNVFVACSVVLVMLTETVFLPIDVSNHMFWAVSVGTVISTIIEIVTYSLTYIKAFKYITNIQSET